MASGDDVAPAMNVRPFIWRNVLRLRGNTLSNIASMRDWESLPRDQVQAKQREKLAALVEYAYRHVPYYKMTLERSGVASASGIRLDRFAQIPALDKPTLRRHYRELLVPGYESRHSYENSTSGSTGEPVRLIQDREYKEWNQAVAATFDRWLGYECGLSRVWLWGSERDVKGNSGNIRGRIGRWLRGETWLSCFRMPPGRMRQYVDEINRTRPVQLVGYVEALNELARLIEQEGLAVHSPQSIVTSAETLYKTARDRISRAFRAPVFNRYGCVEMGPIASEGMGHEGLLVSAPTHFMEILRSDGHPAGVGEIGEIVVTLLTNFSMPLIRYRVGDLGAWRETAASASPSWPGLLEVFGRTSDVLVADDGAKIHSNSFLWVFDPMAFIGQFQIVQETTNSVTVWIVPVDSVPDPERRYGNEMEEITAAFRQALGPKCEVAFRFVDAVPHRETSKFHHVISRLAYG